MKLIIIRHGEPDNPNQTLTEKGFQEAKALGEFYRDLKVDYIYSSPLPRAKLTADEFVKNRDINITVLDWLEEFTHKVNVPYAEGKVCNWDFLPEFFVSQDDFYDNDKYLLTDTLQSGDNKRYYDYVCKEFDALLKKHGYQRDGKIYKTLKANRDTIVLVCHFGMMSVILSHLFNVPYVVLAQFMCCQPTGVTVLVTEERRDKISQFRMLQYGDISHLNHYKIKPSVHGRFCEVFDSDERHD